MTEATRDPKARRLVQVSYISSASEPMSAGDLSQLLTQCRSYNAEHGITGMLLYVNSTFVQVLEGEEAAVDELLERIRRDSRHTDIALLERRRIEQRDYSAWSMGLKRVSTRELQKIRGLQDLSEADISADYLEANAGLVPALMNHFRREKLRGLGQDELSLDESDRLIQVSHWLIRGAVRLLALLMVLTIFWGVVDVVYVLYVKVLEPSIREFRAQDIIVAFGAFLTVLIAIEIFLNITLYLRDDVIHIRLVISTALMAIARKVIIIDFDTLTPLYLFGTAAVVLALGVTYWLVGSRTLSHRSGRGLQLE